MSTRICVHCGKSFQAQGRRKFCDDCDTVTFQCANCGKTTTIKRNKYYRPDLPEDRAHFCSQKCSIGRGSQVAAEQRMNGSMVTCPNCGKSNYRSRTDQARVFCDQTCFFEYRRNHLEEYPSQFERPEIHAKAMATRKRRGTNWALGRTGPKSIFWKGGTTHDRGTSWSVIRELIVKRDQSKCSLCNAPSKRRQLDVHHIVEWVEEKCNHPFNLITVCQRCHLKRIHGNSPAPPIHELVSFARRSTLEQLSPRDFQYILERDAEQREGKPLSQQTIDLLNLTGQQSSVWNQGRLF